MATPVVLDGLDYETVAKSQTGQKLGSEGAKGDVLERLIIIPETTAAGTVALLDGATSVNVLVAGTLGDLKPLIVPIGARSVNTGGWSITTGDNVHVIAVGRFT